MKRIISIAFLFLFVCSVSAQTPDAQPRKKVAVVLSGGGAKGVAHVRALKVIEEAGIPVDMVVGTSMGAIVGGLYSIGYTPAQMDSMVQVQDWLYLLSDRTHRRRKTFLEKVEAEKYVVSIPMRRERRIGSSKLPDGIIKGHNLNDLFTDLTIGFHDSLDFNKLPIPFACVAVDLMEGKEKVFHSGRLTDAMRASMAIPAVFTPVRIDSLVLIDGGILNNYPVDVALDMGAEIVIGVDVQSAPEDKAKLEDMMDMVNRMTDMTGQWKYERNKSKTDLYIKVDVKGYSAASFDKASLDTLANRGEEAAYASWDDLIALKEKIGIAEEYKPDSRVSYIFESDETPILIRNIAFKGMNQKDAQKIMEKAQVYEDSYATKAMLNDAVENLYSLQSYTNITYNLTETDSGYDLVFSLEDNAPSYINFGIRFDSEEVAAVQVGAAKQFNTKIPTRVAVVGRLGKRSSARIDLLTLPSRLRYFNLSYMFEYNDINIYHKGKRQYNTTYSRHFAKLGYTNILSRNTKYGFGLRYEYFDYNAFLFTNSTNTVKVEPEGFFSYYALLQHETKDKKSYPTKGTSLLAEVSVYTDNLTTYDGHNPFGAASLWWESVFSPTRRFSIIPGVYGRVLFGQDAPYPYMNTMGGDAAGRYMPHQIPFVGINFIDIFDKSVVVGRLKLRQRMGKKHYASLITNYALTENNFGDILTGKQIFGMGLGYGYDALVGPIEASFNVSNRTNKLGFYANVGFTF